MLDFLFSSSTVETLTIGRALTVIFSSLLLGLLISVVYVRNQKNKGYSSSFAVTLIMLPAIIAVIILLVGNNVARAFSLAGAFSLIRFRSAPGDPRDIAYVFFTLGVGLACGMGYIGYGALFAVILCLVMSLLNLVKYAENTATPMKLKIIIPEHLDYQGLFDDIFDEYTSDKKLQRLKTVDFGSLFEITYNINMKEGANQKEFIDQLRSRNGNLTIALNFNEINE